MDPSREIPSHRLRDDEQPPEGVDEVQDLKVRFFFLMGPFLHYPKLSEERFTARPGCVH